MRSLFFFAWLLALPGLADTTASPRLTVNLTDGSKLIGATTLKALTLRSEALGKLSVPLERIASVKFSKDRESVTVTLQNGDKIQAGLADTTLPLTTVFGPVTVPLDKATEIQFTVPGKTPNGLVLWYSFDTDDGKTVMDRSGQGNDGTIHGAELAAGSRGKVQTAMRFNGHSAWLEVKNNLGEKLTRQITVSAWVKQSGPGVNWGRIVSGGSPINSVYNLCVLPASDGILWRPILDGESFDAAEVQFPCDLSDWTLVTGTYDSQMTTLYVNGQKVRENRRPGKLTINRQSLAVGGEDGSHEGSGQASWFNGLLDEVQIYDRALSAEEVQRLYEHGK